jgi:signal transduction histidine kinase
MKIRIASIAFLFSSLSMGVVWLTLQPVIVQMIAAIRKLAPPGTAEAELLARVRSFLPFYLALNLLLLTVVCYVVLYAVLGRPLHRMEQAIEQLGRLDLEMPWEAQGGPLLARIQAALKRMAEALHREQATTRRQLAELVSANQQLTRAQTELVSAERLATVGRLAAGVAHEVGNPLAGILGYLSIGKSRSQSSPELVDCLERIDAEVQRIDRIVQGLLDLGRPSRGALAPVEVAQLVETCVRLVSAGPDFGAVEVALDLEPGAVARGESGPLSQVIINLLLNAAQAIQGSGQIKVHSRRDDGHVHIEVEDTGKGIPAAALPHLFEPFFTTKGSNGTGLGLAISMHLVSSMGGQLAAANLPGGGARFTVSLPEA